MTTISATLPRLPIVALAHLGGHWARKYEERKADKEAWTMLLIQAGFRLRTTALLDEPVTLTVDVYYPNDGHRVDTDNMLAGLKPLIDLLEPSHRAGKGFRGHAGWIANDKLITSVHAERHVDPERAPATVLRM